MHGSVRDVLAAGNAADNLAPQPEMLEGVVVAGSWDAAEGVVQVLVGDTIPYESPLFADGNQPFMPVCTLVCPAIGDQYAPVGGERAIIWESQGSWICWLEHGPDDADPTLQAGERQIRHRSASDPDSYTFDSGIKLTNDGPQTGDKLGGTHVGQDGALTRATTKYGHVIELNDATKAITVTTPGGHTATFDDQNQAITVATNGGLTAHLDDVAQAITMSASSGVFSKWDAAGDSLSSVATTVALGDLAENLGSSNRLVRESDLKAAINSVRGGMGDVLQQLLTLVVAKGGIPDPSTATTILTAITAGHLPLPSLVDITSSIAAIDTPACSTTVLAK